MGGGKAADQSFDSEASARVARRVRARFRRCWNNAARAVQHLGSGAAYVEGWVVLNRPDPYVIEHGWCEVGGRVVDPSYTPFVTRGLVEPCPPIAYFGGARFAPERAAEAVARHKLPISWQVEQAEYDDAFVRAWRFAGAQKALSVTPPARVVNSRHEPFDRFIGRPSPWQNPFHIGPDGNRVQVVAKYREWLIRQPSLLRQIQGLRGVVLGCRCTPLPCHGDVLVELANMISPPAPAPADAVRTYLASRAPSVASPPGA